MSSQSRHRNLSLQSTDVAHLLDAGNRAKRAGRYREALISLAEATRWAPRNAAAWLNRGVAHLELSQREEAVACFRRAVALEPFRAEAHNILGAALLQLGRCGAAASHLREALRLRPEYAAACDNLARVLKTQGRSAEAIELHRAALAAQPSMTTHSNLLYSLNLVDRPPGEVAAEHRRWAEIYGCGVHVGLDHGGKVSGCRRAAGHLCGDSQRLRVGFVSGDFCHHAVTFFFEPVLEHADRRRVEIFCYSNLKVADAVTDRLRSRTEPNHWREIAGLSDVDAEKQIRADGIDVLIDLSGHTAGNRLPLFSRRPAAVQATWLGYPNTTGLSQIDWRITDAVADSDEGHHTETLLRLPGPFSVYRPPDDAPAPTAGPREGPLVFGCFNHIAKLSDETIALWSELLRVEPDARLFLKSRGLDDPATRADLRSRFARHGVAAASSRLLLSGRELSVRDHLSLYNAVDVALDPFPYNGATTTCEALLMGVPVVTLAGRAHAGRVGVSMLTHAGFPEGIACTPADYIAAARTLGRATRDASRDLLTNPRAVRARQMRGSALCDGPAFVRALESALFSVAGKNCRAAHAPKKDTPHYSAA